MINILASPLARANEAGGREKLENLYNYIKIRNVLSLIKYRPFDYSVIVIHDKHYANTMFVEV